MRLERRERHRPRSSSRRHAPEAQREWRHAVRRPSAAREQKLRSLPRRHPVRDRRGVGTIDSCLGSGYLQPIAEDRLSCRVSPTNALRLPAGREAFGRWQKKPPVTGSPPRVKNIHATRWLLPAGAPRRGSNGAAHDPRVNDTASPGLTRSSPQPVSVDTPRE